MRWSHVTLALVTDSAQRAELTTIVLVDDHAVVRGALRALLDGQPDFEVVGEAADIASARAAVTSLRTGCLDS